MYVYSDQIDFDADFAKLLTEAESRSIKQRKEKQGYGVAAPTLTKESESPSRNVQSAASDIRQSDDAPSTSAIIPPSGSDDAASDENARAAALAK
jgi:hypothetical protein